MKWQPIETAPKNGSFVWLCEPHTGDPRTGGQYKGYWSDELGWTLGITSDDGTALVAFKLSLTHWMPLPSKPGSSGDETDADHNEHGTNAEQYSREFKLFLTGYAMGA